MHLTYDIWHEVVKYFEHQVTGEIPSEKRAALLNLAVASRMLSGLALATLWKNMRSLKPIVDVINSFAPVQEDPPLTWVEGGNHKYWLVRRPDGDQIVLRVKEYLARIRVLWVWDRNEEECALWPVLIAWFWKDEALLPNLQELSIYFMDGFGTSYQYLAFMVPLRPKLMSMEGTKQSEHMITFYQLLHSRGCSPTEVEYIGDVYLPPTLTLFKNMNSLIVCGPYKHAKHRSPYSLLELLQQLPSLGRLEIDLAALRIQTTKPLDTFDHLSLEMLSLDATIEELHPFLSFDITCPVVKEFSLRVWCNTGLSWKFLFDKLVSVFPNLCELMIEVTETAAQQNPTPQLIFSDLAELLSQPMESLILDTIPNKLTQEDLRQMLEAWPELHTLTLTGGKMSLNADTLLFTFTYQNLQALHLPLNFIPLASPLARNSATRENPLRHLQAAPPTQLPSTLKEKVVLAQNLLRLLPELETVKIDDTTLGAGATDLQDIIDGMQTVIAAHSS